MLYSLVLLNMIEQEKIYINGTLKALKISTNNIYRLAKVFNKDRNTIQETISDDTISEITVIESIENIEKDNHNENDDGSGDYSNYTNSEGGEENNGSDYVEYADTDNQLIQRQTLFKKCIFCLQLGHWAKNCNLIPVNYNQHCFHCWSTGHFANTCMYQLESRPPWMSDKEFGIFKNNKKVICSYLYMIIRFF